MGIRAVCRDGDGMQSVKTVICKGDKRVARNHYLLRKGNEYVIMSFRIWWISMIFGGIRRRRSMNLTGWNDLKDVSFVGDCL